MNLRLALQKPPKSSRRSWPSKRSISELRRAWSSMSTEDRVRLSTLSRAEYWFIQACDIAMLDGTFRAMSAKAPDAGPLSLYSLRTGAGLLEKITVQTEPSLELSLDAEAVEDEEMLGLLLAQSVTRASDRDELTRLALCYPYEMLFEQLPVISKLALQGLTWGDVNRVVATLFLDAILHRHENMVRFEREEEKEREQDMETCDARGLELIMESEEKRRPREARRPRRARRRRKEACGAEDAAQEGELEGLSSCGEGAEEALLNQSASDAKVCIEAERDKALELLRSAPSWDISILSEKNTFLTWDEPRAALFRHREV